MLEPENSQFILAFIHAHIYNGNWGRGIGREVENDGNTLIVFGFYEVP